MRYLVLSLLLLPVIAKAFVPSDLSGLQLDIDPEQESGADGSAKATLTDQSGNGRTLTALTTPNATIEWAECNGKKIIRRPTTAKAYELAADLIVTDFTLCMVMKQVDAGLVIFAGNAANTTLIETSRASSGGDYLRILGPSRDFRGRGLRSATAYGAYMLQQESTACRLFDAGEACPSLIQPTGTAVTMTFRRFFGTGSSNNNVDVARILLWDRSLTQAELRQLGGYVYTQYGISPKALFVAEGNSYVPDVTDRGALSKSILANHKDDIDVFNVGLSGDTISGMQSEYATEVAPLYSSYRPFNIVGAYEFTNSLSSSAVLNATLAAYWNYCDTVRADGFQLVAVTPTAWHSTNVTVEAGYQALWPLMRAQWTSHADALADPAILTVFDEDADTTNTTYYNADRLHLVAAGSTLVADLVQTQVEALMAGTPPPSGRTYTLRLPRRR